MTSFLALAIGDGLYAVESTWLRANLRTHAGVRGDVPLHGVSFPVVDPRAVFGLPPVEAGCDALLLETTEGRVALLSDRTVGRVEVADERWQELPWSFGGRERLWFSGVVALDDGRPLVRLRPSGLLASFHTVENEADRGSWAW